MMTLELIFCTTASKGRRNIISYHTLDTLWLIRRLIRAKRENCNKDKTVVCATWLALPERGGSGAGWLLSVAMVLMVVRMRESFFSTMSPLWREVSWFVSTGLKWPC